LESPSRADPTIFIDLSWLHERLVGRKTLASYGLNFSNRRRLMQVHAEALLAVPPSHKEFLKACVLTYETKMLFFCHARI
jgi:serine/threonine protein phosphatase 1